MGETPLDCSFGGLIGFILPEGVPVGLGTSPGGRLNGYTVHA